MEDFSPDDLARLKSDALISGREDLALLYRGLFGVSDLSATLRSPLIYNSLNKVVGAIASDLNTKQFHFLLELLQNCSDNLYAEEIQPCAQLALLSPNYMPDEWKRYAPHGVLIVRNNEIGFRCKDLFSLSQASMSSKENLRGFVGQKGMGFKCVFVASAKPHIVSGNLQVFYSDEIEHPAIPLQYLPPYWIEDEEFVTSIRSSAPEQFQGGTTIFLPLRSETIREQLRAELRGITHTMLMFLPKLANIQITEDDRTRVLHFEQDEKPLFTTTVKTHGLVMKVFNAVDMDRRQWYLCTSEADMSEIVEPSRSSESFHGYRPVVSLAFPVDAKLRQQVRDTSTLMAFLPTELKTRTPCFINSDFLLIASRDTIKSENAWNQRLLQCAAEQFAAFLEAMVQRCAATPVEMLEWIDAMESMDKRNDIDVVLNTHFNQVAVRSLKRRRVCMISEHAEDYRIFLKPHECFSYPPKAVALLEACQSTPSSVPKTILDFNLLEAHNAVQKLHNLGVNQKTSFDFMEILVSNVAWAREETARSDEWLMMLINWLSRNFGAGQLNTVGPFVKQILPLEPLPDDPAAALFASQNDKIYLVSEAAQCQKYCPASVGRVVKASLASELQKVSAWLQIIGAAFPTFSEIEFARQMSGQGHLKAMAASTHFLQVSSLVGHVFSKHRMGAELRKLLVRTRGGELVEFGSTYCESKIEHLKQLWQGSNDATWACIPSKAIHPDYGLLLSRSLSELSSSWHQLCGSGIPTPPRSQQHYLLPPAIRSQVSSLQNGFTTDTYGVYKQLLRVFVDWLTQVESTTIIIEPQTYWLQTNKSRLLSPQLTFAAHPDFDPDHAIPILYDDELRAILQRVQHAVAWSDMGEYLRFLQAAFPQPDEFVTKWFDAICPYWVRTRATSPSSLPDVTAKRWDSQWTVSSVSDVAFNDYDDLLSRCGFRNWAHPRFLLPKTSAALLSTSLQPLQTQQIIRVITAHHDSILPRLSGIYQILVKRITVYTNRAGSWVRCHNEWRSVADLYWEPLPSTKLGPYPEAFEGFNGVNAAADTFLTGIPTLAAYLQSVAIKTGPTVYHVNAAMDHFNSSVAMYSKEMRLTFAKWAYATLKQLGGKPQLFLSESGLFYPANAIYIPSSKWTLSESCSAKVPTAAVAEEFKQELLQWGVQPIDKLVKEPSITLGTPLHIPSHPELQAAVSMLPDWFFKVLAAYVKTRFSASRDYRIQLLSKAEVRFYEKLQRTWEFQVPEIEVKPEPIRSCFMDSGVYISSVNARRDADFIDLVVATCIVGVVPEYKPSDIRDACSFMKCCLFKHSLQPQTAESCIADISQPDVNVHVIAKQLSS